MPRVHVEVVSTAEASPALLADIRALLHEVFEEDFSDEDWEHSLGGSHVVVRVDGALVAHAAVVPRDIWVGERRFACGYVEAVAVDRRRHGEGFGSIAMTRAARVIRRSFELGVLSTGRHAFFERLGWERWQGPTFVRAGTRLVRTVDEDDGVMVLRFGSSSAVDRSSSITCLDRTGDAW